MIYKDVLNKLEFYASLGMACGETLKGQNLPVIPRYPGWPEAFVFVPGRWDPSLSSGGDSFPLL